MRFIRSMVTRERKKMEGKLFLCATPIGNLEDITLRVLDTLKEVELIAAEDTRHSIKLLNHFEIRTPMTSYHEFNKIEKAAELVQRMKAGVNVALITDAGTPAISDPGEELVRQCHQAGIVVTSLPGPAACITALTVSGLFTRRFCFEGFLPSAKKDRALVLEGLKSETRTIILYEAPHHIVKTCRELYETLGNKKITLCRELTKKFETITPTTLADALESFELHPPKGEYVIVMEGVSFEEIEMERIRSFETMTIEEHMNSYLDKGMDRKEAMKSVAKDRGIPKREVYQYLLER